MFLKRSLRATITVAFASLLLIMAVVNGFAVREVQTTEVERRLVSDGLLSGAAAADRIALNALRFDDALQTYVSTRSPDDLSIARLSQAMVQRAAARLSEVQLADPGDQYLAAQVEAAAGDFEKQAPQAERYAISTPANQASTFDLRYLQGTLTTLVTAAEGLGDRLEGQAGVIRSQITRREERLTRSLVIAFLLAGLVGVVLVLYCLRLVTEPVGRLVQAARAVEAGDYSRVRRLSEVKPGLVPKTSENELTALSRAFSHMAGALEEREQQLRAQAADLAETNASLIALQSLTDVALSDLPLDLLLEQLLQRAVAGVGADAGAIYLRDPGSGRLEHRAGVNLGAPEDREAASAAVQEWMASLPAEGLVVPCEEWAAGSLSRPPSLIRPETATFLAAPVCLSDQVIGVAHLDSDRRCSFPPSALNLIRVLGERVARAVERARSMEELEVWGRELERRVEHQKEQLLRAEHLAVIGLVGGSIAHELRNPLGVISNAVYFLRGRSAAQDAKVQRHLEIIEREVKHSKHIIDALVDYATEIEPEARRLDLNEVIRAAIEYSAVPETVTLELELDENLPMVIGDEEQFLQVFGQLVRNAIQAMEGRGTLRISTGAWGVAVRATVADTGPGVPLADQQRIFEPLVTSRAKGIGLGLALVKKILEAHGGGIRLASQPGRGAVFTVELPITERLTPPPAAIAPPR